MPFHVECPSCANVLTAPETASGQQIFCPNCQQAMTLPQFVPPVATPVRTKSRPPVRRDRDTTRTRSREEPDYPESSFARIQRIKPVQPATSSFVVGGVALTVHLAITIGVIWATAAIGLSKLTQAEANPQRDSARPEIRKPPAPKPSVPKSIPTRTRAGS